MSDKKLGLFCRPVTSDNIYRVVSTRNGNSPKRPINKLFSQGRHNMAMELPSTGTILRRGNSKGGKEKWTARNVSGMDNEMKVVCSACVSDIKSRNAKSAGHSPMETTCVRSVCTNTKLRRWNQKPIDQWLMMTWKYGAKDYFKQNSMHIEPLSYISEVSQYLLRLCGGMCQNFAKRLNDPEKYSGLLMTSMGGPFFLVE